MTWPSIRLDISLRTLKSLQIYLLTINTKKTFRRIFSYKFGCGKKTLRDFLASRSSPSKTINTAPASRLKLYAKRLRIFRDTIMLVFVNENCCLCKCFTELYFFFWLLVVSLSILIAFPCRLFSSFVNIACRSTQNCRAYQTLYKITHRYNWNH